ncbi:hypothetical protein OG252_03415 [Streptomyces sp. NBC_01352]|nr:hypothetical protein [Streptomyces sp. NBC_01352]
MRMLQEALETVDARIEAVSETLRQLHRPASSHEAEWLKRSLPCLP